jgi:uncharacterized membrane protein YoaK (UPF0700 family)
VRWHPKTSEPQSVHETTLIALTLSMLGGYLDAYTYVLKDGVFANAQTGNVVLFSISLLTGSYHDIGKYLLPILFFCMGILILEFLKTAKALDRNTLRVKLILLIEALTLFFIGMTSHRVSNFVVTCTIAFLAAIQVSTFNRLYSASIATTMITGNLRSSMENLHAYLHYGNRKARSHFIRYFLVIAFFGLGASLGAVISLKIGDDSIFPCLVFIATAYGLLSVKERKFKKQERVIH